jgi:hypothetical protein
VTGRLTPAFGKTPCSHPLSASFLCRDDDEHPSVSNHPAVARSTAHGASEATTADHAEYNDVSPHPATPYLQPGEEDAQWAAAAAAAALEKQILERMESEVAQYDFSAMGMGDMKQVEGLGAADPFATANANAYGYYRVSQEEYEAQEKEDAAAQAVRLRAPLQGVASSSPSPSNACLVHELGIVKPRAG